MRGKKLKKLFRSIVICLVIFIFSSSIIMADQDGTGGGGGPDAPFELISQSINNNQKNVDTDLSIKLMFSKNIAGSNVIENNKQCFSIKDKDGNEHSVNVNIVSDQVNFDARRNVSIDVNGLKEGTTYKLYISNNITARNGQKLIKSYTISFKTKESEKNSSSDEKDTISSKDEEVSNSTDDEKLSNSSGEDNKNVSNINSINESQDKSSKSENDKSENNKSENDESSNKEDESSEEKEQNKSDNKEDKTNDDSELNNLETANTGNENMEESAEGSLLNRNLLIVCISIVVLIAGIFIYKKLR